MNPEKWNIINEGIQGQPSGPDGTIDPNVMKPFIGKWVYPYAPPHLYPKILDCGCGPGTELKVLKDLGYEPTGITLGKPNIEYSIKNYGITPLEADMHDLPFSPGTFDAVLFHQSWEHSFAPWLLMLEVWVVLKEKGRLILDLPSPRNKAMWAMWHVNLQYVPQIRFMFEKCGFQILYAEEEGGESLEYDGGGEPYDYIVEKMPGYPDNYQHVLRRLEEYHRSHYR